jgi:plastocyanin
MAGPRRATILFVGLAAAGMLLLQASVVVAAGAGVTIDNYKYVPASIVVKPGTTITWTNKQEDDNHTVTADDGSFDSGIIKAKGGTGQLTFSTEGTFAYHCKIHSFMHGKVVVSATAVEPPATDETDFLRGDGAAGAPIPLPFALMLAGVGFLVIAGSLAVRRVAVNRTRSR